MDFVDDVYLDFSLRRSIGYTVSDCPEIIDAPVGCRIHFNDINMRALVDGLTLTACITGFIPYGVFTIQSFCNDSCDSCFSRSSWTGKNVCMRITVFLERLGKKPLDVFLSSKF